MLATGFFHVDCAVTLQRLYCLLVMESGVNRGSRSVLWEPGGAIPPGHPTKRNQDGNIH